MSTNKTRSEEVHASMVVARGMEKCPHAPKLQNCRNCVTLHGITETTGLFVGLFSSNPIGVLKGLSEIASSCPQSDLVFALKEGSFLGPTKTKSQRFSQKGSHAYCGLTSTEMRCLDHAASFGSSTVGLGYVKMENMFKPSRAEFLSETKGVHEKRRSTHV